MSAETLFLLLMSLALLPVAAFAPRALFPDVVAVFSALALAALSPISAFWLVGSSCLTWGAMWLGDRFGQRGLIAAIWAVVLVVVMAASREMSHTLWVGVAYFSLRNIHVLFDVWMGRLTTPSLRRLLCYQLFLPVLLAGPIHRIQTYERQLTRRRPDAAQFFQGAERMLLGLAQALLLGGWLVGHIKVLPIYRLSGLSVFLESWANGMVGWLELYFVFAGFSSVAVGLSLMLGIRLEENFNAPFLARNLIEFWQRWHISLSQWCRDYVFHPVTAATRSPVLGVVAAMVAIGLWHEVSFYYFGWAIWQALGLILTRLGQRILAHPKVPLRAEWVDRLIGPVLVFSWVTLAKPIVGLIIAGGAP